MKTKAVLFDLGDTLVTAWLLEVTFQKILSSQGINRSIEEVKEAFEKTRLEFDTLGYAQKYGKLQHGDYWNLWRSFVLKHLGFQENEKLIKKAEAKWYNFMDCEAYPDVVETLSKLKRMGLKTGLISTAYEKDILMILKRAGLDAGLFDVVIGAGTIEEMKPHPEVFRHALSKLRIKPEEAVFVGDRVEADYKAAEKAGIEAVLIQRWKDSAEDVRGLRTIKGLSELFRFIE